VTYSPGNFDREHGYLQWGGSLPGGEEWSCGLRFAATEGITVPIGVVADWDYEAMLDMFVPIVSDFHHDSLMGISSRANLEFLKFNRIDVTGHYSESITHQRVVGPLGGGLSSGHPANQVALVVTLTTAVTRGPAHAGRFYLPMPCFTPSTDGLITIATAAAAATRVKGFIEALSDWPGIDIASDGGVCIMSRKAGAPATRRVDGAKVGRVLDTQRRRRRSLREQYLVETVDQGTF
jgi:hypothetical protein